MVGKENTFPRCLGYNSRLDALQAAILRVKLRYIDVWNERRRELAQQYNRQLLDHPAIGIPFEVPGDRHVYHLYIIRVLQRERVRAALKDAGIASAVYYPQPLHLTEPCKAQGYNLGDFPNAEQASKETLALPL